jgi:predicted RND superfamily exporter protein
MKRLTIIRQMIQFLSEEKKYWLIPLVILLIAIGLLVVFMQVVAPWLWYPLA